MKRSTWIENAGVTAAVAIASRAASPGAHHHANRIFADYSAATFGTLALKHGTTTIATFVIIDQREISLDGLRVGGLNEAISAELSAGAAGVQGRVQLTGYTE
jgi:cytosine/adenosine deaminase-related metal-dependent hydrolase